MAFHVTIAAIRVTFWISKSCILVVSFFHSRMPRTTQTQLLHMKKKILERYIGKELTREAAASLLGIHPNALSRLKKRYQEYGESALLGRKPGPRRGTPDNKTPEHIENIVLNIAQDLSLGPLSIAEKLFDEQRIQLNQSTVWRILKRRGARYTTEYRRWRKDPQYYCLESPGEELQLDACFPFGRARKLVVYDAIDDCSRFVCAKAYVGTECDDLAVAFMKELIEKTPFRIRSVRVDNKFGKKFKEFCASVGIAVITNDPYSPEQNGKIERWHKTEKQECIYKYCKFTDSLDQINYQLQLYLHYYNYQRRHSGFGMNRLTPAQKIVSAWKNSLPIISTKNVTGILQQYNNGFSKIIKSGTMKPLS